MLEQRNSIKQRTLYFELEYSVENKAMRFDKAFKNSSYFGKVYRESQKSKVEYFGTFLTVCRKAKGDGQTSTVEISGIIFMIFDHF